MWKFFSKMVDHITCPPCGSYNFSQICFPLNILHQNSPIYNIPSFKFTMSSTISSNLSTIQQNPTPVSLGTLCKSLAISGLILFLFYTFLFNPPNYQPSDLLSTINQKWLISSPIISTNSTKTNISHIGFGIVGTTNTCSYKKS